MTKLQNQFCSGTGSGGIWLTGCLVIVVAMLPYLFIEPIKQQFSSLKDLWDLVINDIKGKHVYKVQELGKRMSYDNGAFSYS